MEKWETRRETPGRIGPVEDPAWTRRQLLFAFVYLVLLLVLGVLFIASYVGGKRESDGARTDWLAVAVVVGVAVGLLVARLRAPHSIARMRAARRSEATPPDPGRWFFLLAALVGSAASVVIVLTGVEWLPAVCFAAGWIAGCVGFAAFYLVGAFRITRRPTIEA